MPAAANKCFVFALVHKGVPYKLQIAQGKAVHIGRASSGAIVLEKSSVSGQHVEFTVQPAGADNAAGGAPKLMARDRSRNGTGLRQTAHYIGDGEGPPKGMLRRLGSEAPEELVDGSELVVPFRQPGNEDEERVVFTVCLNPSAADFLAKPAPSGQRVLCSAAPAENDAKAVSDGANAVNDAHDANGANGASRVNGANGASLPIEVEPAKPAEKPAPVPMVPQLKNLPTAAGSAGGRARGPDSPVQYSPQRLAAASCAAAGVKSLTSPGSMASAPNLDRSMLPDMYDPITKTGRWRYDAKLGEGGLGVVYRALDVTGKLGEVAVKVHKPRSRGCQRDGYFLFEMHRESAWSRWCLHNEFDARFKAGPSALFGRYLEDHTGFLDVEPHGFDAKRKKFEAPDFDWDKEGPKVNATTSLPYVVMELVRGEALHTAIDREFQGSRLRSAVTPVLSSMEKRALLLQAARALEYLAPFGLIHRDFRGCNMSLMRRTGVMPQLRVLDLGVMICAEDGQSSNSNQAVQVFRRRFETEEKRRTYDWVPWEVRGVVDGTGPVVNFEKPVHSFDVFSLGVLMLHMLIGRSKARRFLDSLQNNSMSTVDTTSLGIEASLLLRMLGKPFLRPHPSEIVAALERAVVPAPSRGLQDLNGRSRSRSRDRRRAAAKEGSSRCIAEGLRQVSALLSVAENGEKSKSTFRAERGLSTTWVVTYRV